MHGFHTRCCATAHTHAHVLFSLAHARLMHQRIHANIEHTWYLVHVCKSHSRNSVLKLVALLLPCELRLQAYRAPIVNHGCCGRNGALGENEKILVHEHFTACNTQLRCARVVVLLCLCVSCVSVFFVSLCLCASVLLRAFAFLCRCVSVSLCLCVYVFLACVCVSLGNAQFCLCISHRSYHTKIDQNPLCLFKKAQTNNASIISHKSCMLYQ